jgi:IS5 family transposase
MNKTSKRRAPTPEYVSEKQLVLSGFETPFSQTLDKSNRWVQLADKIPWDDLAGLYYKRYAPKATGRPPLNPRIVIGALIIKHMCNLDDRETIAQITENIYMQYFLGYSALIDHPPFDPSLFVEIRKRLGDDLLGEMNLRILEIAKVDEGNKGAENPRADDGGDHDSAEGCTHKGELLMDATVASQDIAYPTDLNLLNRAREITEKIIDALHVRGDKKPRTYRKVARKAYLKVAQNRNPSKKAIRKGVGQQLRYVGRNLKHIDVLLDSYDHFPLSHKKQRQLWVVHTLYEQQHQMFKAGETRIADRIVSIHEPHVRPIMRGKAWAKTEFGSKIHLSLVDGYAYLDTLCWDAFHEGNGLSAYVAKYKQRFGFYPEKVLVDKLYCTRANRKWLKEKGVKLSAKPLGRPSARAVEDHVRPGERNPIEGKFGQAKNGYGMNRIRARLKQTSQSWIASIILVLNLVKLAGEAPLCLSFSALQARILTILTAIYGYYGKRKGINIPQGAFRACFLALKTPSF